MRRVVKVSNIVEISSTTSSGFKMLLTWQWIGNNNLMIQTIIKYKPFCKVLSSFCTSGIFFHKSVFVIAVSPQLKISVFPLPLDVISGFNKSIHALSIYIYKSNLWIRITFGLPGCKNVFGCQGLLKHSPSGDWLQMIWTKINFINNSLSFRSAELTTPC